MVNTGKRLLFVVIAGVVAVRPFQRCFAGMDVAFQHDFGARGNLQAMAQAFDDFGFRAAQQPRELVFAQGIRHRRDGTEYGRRVRPQRHRDRIRLARIRQQNSRKSSAPPRCASQRMMTLFGPITCWR